MSNSMRHWNGHQLCAIDVETSGLDPSYHEILQICILPLDSNSLPRRDVMPFFIELIPEFPLRVDRAAIRANKLDILRITQRGHDQEKAKDLLEDWVNKLSLPYTKYGNRKRIMPLAHNWQFDKSFIQSWLGASTYSEIFDARYRDTQVVAAFLNDVAGMHAETVPYSKINLNWLCKENAIKNEKAHDALQDCVATAKVYNKLLCAGLIG